MTDERITVTLSPKSLSAISKKSKNRSGALDALISRYETALMRSRTDLRKRFTVEEIGYLFESCKRNLDLFSNPSALFAWTDIEESLLYVDVLNRNQEFDAKTFMRKIDQLSYTDQMAILDALERWNCSEEESRRIPEDVLLEERDR